MSSALRTIAGAEAMYRQKLALEKKLSGEESQGFADALGGLALTLEKRGNLAGAEETDRQALALWQMSHLDTAGEAVDRDGA